MRWEKRQTNGMQERKGCSRWEGCSRATTRGYQKGELDIGLEEKNMTQRGPVYTPALPLSDLDDRGQQEVQRQRLQCRLVGMCLYRNNRPNLPVPFEHFCRCPVDHAAPGGAPYIRWRRTSGRSA